MVRAVVVDKGSNGVVDARLRDVEPEFLGSSGMLVNVEYSSLNFKDALALSGAPGVARILPLIPGIDVIGNVAESGNGFAQGDRVVLNGAGCGETRHGGYAEQALVDPEATIRIPDTLSSLRAAAIGTAGFTAALATISLGDHGVRPDSGPILVTGATGGVGSIAVLLLAEAGYSVVAATGRVDRFEGYLHELGASEVIDAAELAAPGKSLQRARWAGAIDSLGSHTLVNVLSQTKWGGVVTSCGLAQGADLPATVMPFILRAVSLVGINSVDAPRPLRERAWNDLAHQLDFDNLDSVVERVALGDVVSAGAELLGRSRHGRTVVDVTAA